MANNQSNLTNLDGIAIVGMSGKFPGVENIHEYWSAITNGKVLLSRFSKEELAEKGVDKEKIAHKHFVPVNGLINTAEFFDSNFFGFSPREADLTDPQHRKFLEVCYEALEHAGQSPEEIEKNGSIGVFAGCSMNQYLLKNLLQHPELLKSNGEFQTIVNNDKDFLTTKVSYKLNLTGPSFDIQTACSTSLVAVHVACQNLLNYQCNVALAGGSHILNPRGHGYMFKQGGIESPDGICRPFDKDANGTVFGEGVGAVVLKRLEDAVKDKDEIWAVIRSSAINNDGSLKIGYMAPSIDGQAEAISMALQFGDLDAGSISYIEAHGTGTNLGDPIEISGLSKVYKEYTDKTGYCAIGSVKGNIGHCDVAAGVAGLIKTAMALKYKKLPPSINFENVNPELYLDETPFYVNTELQDWNSDGPRRAAVSSFGIGGTNAHCILEEWEENKSGPSANEIHMLPLSAKTDNALSAMVENLVDYLDKTQSNIADIAHTLQTGRNTYSNRTLLIGHSASEIAQRFKDNPSKLKKGKQTFTNPATVFMFTGQGSQYINMAKGLYEEFTLAKNVIDEAHEILAENLSYDFKGLLFNDADDQAIKDLVNKTEHAQPLLFVVQYATACLLTDFGIYPDALIGHSIGELTAATFSGVISFEDALLAVAHRGKIMQQQVTGSMLSINLSSNQVEELLTEGVEISLENAPGYTVVSGTHEAIEQFELKLKEENNSLHTTILKTSHAFHSKLMEPALEPFINELSKFEFQDPEIPFISNVTGTWITPEQAKSAQYWADHIRSTVKFSKGVNELLHSENELIVIEVGPGNSLSMLLSQFESPSKFKTISTIRHPRVSDNDSDFLYRAVGDYWSTGGKIEWEELYDEEDRYKVPLPTYPFEQTHHWINPVSNKGIHDPGTYNSVASTETDISESETTVNHSEIASSGHSRPNLGTAYEPAQNEAEKVIVKIWEELLGINGIGINDNFFDLGGHSLLASQVIVRINENFDIVLPLDSIFSNQTINEIVSKNNLEVAKKVKVEEAIQIDYENDYPLSLEQRRLWLINKIDENNPAYNIPFTYRLKGALNIEILNESFKFVTERHLALKSIVLENNGEPRCKISKEDYNLDFIDLTKQGIKEIEFYVQDFLGEETRKSFNIEKGPLVRCKVLKINEDEFVFHLVVQHMVFDGWSWGIFSKEISQAYNDFSQKRQPELPNLELQYFDFIAWQEKELKKGDSKESIAFWKEQLDGIPVETKFPYDYKRPEIISGLGERELIELDSNLTQKLKNISKENDSTLFMTLLTGLGALINLYTGEADICIGVPTANRTQSRWEKLIGFFVNTIVLRLAFDKKLSFKDTLIGNRKSYLDSLDHQDLPFERLVDILQPERILNVNPLFQIMFAWQNSPRPPLSFSGIKQEQIVLEKGISPLDLTFYMWEQDGGIVGEIEFNSDILSRETIIHLKHNFIALLNQVVDHQELSLKDLSGISDYTQKSLNEFNNTSVELPGKLLHQLFEDSVQQFPEKTAIKCLNKEYSYREVNEKANQLANYLIENKLNRGFIGVSLPRSEQMLITILAILKTGANYLPLDPDFPDDRLRYIVNDSEAKTVITTKQLKHQFKRTKAKMLLLDKLSKKIAKSPSGNPGISFAEDSLAYTIYTSGSTGNPKGVKVPHVAAVNFIQSMANTPGMSSEDKLLAVTTLSFDISVLEMFLPISVGGTVIIADNEESSDGKELINIIRKEGVSILQATPATWNLLLLQGWEGDKNLVALCGGEAIQPRLIKELLPKVKELWNMYGPTETTVWSTCYKITDTDAPVLVGTPIENTGIYILNSENKVLPQGVFGEVGIGGAGVTKGYHNRDELTMEKFIYNKDYGLIYKTGDLGRILTSGQVELAGRLDNQIKLRGFRIEPGEIETILGKETGVKEAVVKIQKFDELDERLVAFIARDNFASIDIDKIKSNISTHLPNYMIPSNFLVLDSFPKTPNGKIDKKALVFEYDHTPEESKQPSSEIELKLAEIWKKKLKLKAIGVDQNFFDAGGHSLTAIELIADIEKHFDITIGIRHFFERPTIADLAVFISSHKIQDDTLDAADSTNDNDEEVIIKGEI